MAIQRQQAADQGLGNMSGPENHHVPAAGIEDLKEQLHFATTCHADVALEVPLDQMHMGLQVARRQ
jgi:hypothetical protein